MMYYILSPVLAVLFNEWIMLPHLNIYFSSSTLFICFYINMVMIFCAIYFVYFLLTFV